MTVSNPHILIRQCLEDALRYDGDYAIKALERYNDGRYVIVFSHDEMEDRVEYSFPDDKTVRFTIYV